MIFGGKLGRNKEEKPRTSGTNLKIIGKQQKIIGKL